MVVLENSCAWYGFPLPLRIKEYLFRDPYVDGALSPYCEVYVCMVFIAASHGLDCVYILELLIFSKLIPDAFVVFFFCS